MSVKLFVIFAMFMFGVISAHYINDKTTNVDNGTVFPDKTTCVRNFLDKRRCKRIIGGTPAKLGDWPWIAALGYQRPPNYSKISWKCGGTLITNKHIITAAHCVNDLNGLELTTVRLGELDLDESVLDGSKTSDFSIQNIIRHPDYDKHQIINDIAIVTLYDNVPFTKYVRPICLPIELHGWHSFSFEGIEMYVAGWGRRSNKKFVRHTTLREVEVPTLSLVTCKSAYTNQHNVIDSRVICAGKEGKDSCQGDSGGPLMYKENNQYFLVGVVSAGSTECGKKNMPGVYTRITYFIDWILTQIKDS